MNFALILFVLLVISGIAWVADKLIFAPQRRLAGIDRQPLWLEYTAGFFPVICAVFVLRSFIVEPFKIPSGSMIPTLQIGDFILVNKFTYGIRLPVINQKVIDVGSPKRGDVMVFRYPRDESVDYIKRVVGLPGDKILYQDKQLYINGQKLDMSYIDDYTYESAGLNQVHAKRFKEQLGDVNHDLLIEENSMSREGAFEVPEGQYFAMGDNRDNSRDSRYWGFVPEQNLVGKAFFIWWNFDQFKRIGTSIH